MLNLRSGGGNAGTSAAIPPSSFATSTTPYSCLAALPPMAFPCLQAAPPSSQSSHGGLLPSPYRVIYPPHKFGLSLTALSCVQHAWRVDENDG
jgi:hypothetical protein